MTILETYLGITPETPEAEVLKLLIELGAQFVGAHEGSLLVVDEATQELVFAMTVNRESAPEALAGQRVPLGKGLVGLAAQTHQVQIGAPIFHLEHGEERSKAEGPPKAEIAAPLVVNDNLAGVITAVSFQEDKRFTSADALLYARLAMVAAIVIDQRRRLTALAALSSGKKVSGPMGEDDRLNLEIVESVGHLVKARPEVKVRVARLLSSIQALVES